MVLKEINLSRKIQYKHDNAFPVATGSQVLTTDCQSPGVVAVNTDQIKFFPGVEITRAIAVLGVVQIHHKKGL